MLLPMVAGPIVGGLAGALVGSLVGALALAPVVLAGLRVVRRTAADVTAAEEYVAVPA